MYGRSRGDLDTGLPCFLLVRWKPSSTELFHEPLAEKETLAILKPMTSSKETRWRQRFDNLERAFSLRTDAAGRRTLSEDLQSGRSIGGLTIVDPFV